jgi:transcriptional regulator of acetoin/glycerol metabolism
MQRDATTERTYDTPNAGPRRKLVLRSVLPGDDAAVELSGERWLIGREGASDLSLSYSGVSRRHAEIERLGPSLSIRDAGSTNGTYVDGTRIDHVSLASGSVLRVGDWLGIIEEHPSDDAGPYTYRELAPGIWGGAVLARTLRPLFAAASSSVPVILVGRTGSGKERFARALHALGGADRPFHAVNCAALPSDLAEAELFGYRKGAFTGAERGYAGHLRAAHGGTLFLDEIADLPLALQAKVLRALDTGELAPLGEAAEQRFDARLVVACQVPLETLVLAGKFREDLAARLNGLVVELPTVSERRGDVPCLFSTFLRRHAGGSPPAVSTRLYEQLCRHDWPGNVREIELLARQLLAVHGLDPVLRRSHLPEVLRSVRPKVQLSPEERADLDIDKLTHALATAQGNVKRAAEIAGISRQRAYRLIGSHQLRKVVVASREPGADHERDD